MLLVKEKFIQSFTFYTISILNSYATILNMQLRVKMSSAKTHIVALHWSKMYPPFCEYYIYLLFHPPSGELSLTDKLRECLQLSKRLMESFYCLIITLDEDGILVVRNSEPEEPFLLSKKDRVRCDLIFSSW